MLPLPKTLLRRARSLTVLLAIVALPSIQAADLPLLTVKNFESDAFAYSYGTWEYGAESGSSGLRISGGATSKGGGGGPLSLDLTGHRYLRITLRKLPEHRADSINLILMGEDGTGSGYRVALTPVTDAWTTVQVDLLRDSFRPPDMPNGPLTLGTVLGYQLQGTYSNDNIIALKFLRIEASAHPLPTDIR